MDTSLPHSPVLLQMWLHNNMQSEHDLGSCKLDAATNGLASQSSLLAHTEEHLISPPLDFFSGLHSYKMQLLCSLTSSLIPVKETSLE